MFGVFGSWFIQLPGSVYPCVTQNLSLPAIFMVAPIHHTGEGRCLLKIFDSGLRRNDKI
jgi:hypothetical protein